MLVGAVLALPLVLSTAAVSTAQKYDPAVKKYMLDSEAFWAASCAATNRTRLNDIQANDFVGTVEQGNRYTKANECMTESCVPDCKSNHFNGAEFVWIGEDAAVLFGNESWVHLDGSKGMFVWTDTWAKRNGLWQIVAANDFTVLHARSERAPATRRYCRAGWRAC